MRGTRWLILLAIVAILGGVGIAFRLQQRALEQQAPAKPGALPLDLNASAVDWHFRQTEGNRTVAEITAKNFSQVKDSSRVDLEGVELKIYPQEGDKFHLVKSAKAAFFTADKRLYSEGEVEITLSVPAEGPAKGALVSIRSSGVTFDSATGRASTDRAANFRFENGEGKCVGAEYDPKIQELRMKSQAELHWHGSGKPGSEMKLEAGDLLYKESEATVWLSPWARLTRGASVVESGPASVKLDEGAIRLIDAVQAHGKDSYPNRQLNYSADELSVHYADSGEVDKVTAQKNAKLVSVSATTQTTITAGRVDLEFKENEEGSELSTVLARDAAVLESKPLPQPGRQLPETQMLRSEAVNLKMRAGGREIEQMETLAPGQLEFLPNRAGQRHRKLDAERMWIAYGAANRVESFRAVAVKTETLPAAEERARNQAAPPVYTRSRNMTAAFDPKTSQMTQMEQWDDFTYQEGERHARAARGTLDATANAIKLEKAATVSDASGSTTADLIRLDQRTGNFSAEGHVNSTRIPDQKKPGSDMLAKDEPMHAMARKMTSTGHNRLVHYEGGVVLWQGANRILADAVDIDRDKRAMTANGKVMTQFVDEDTKAVTIVKASRLVYSETGRLAHYTGGVVLTQPATEVHARELRAWLAESDADSRLEKAFADGDVKVVQSASGRTRTGTGQHCEYYVDEGKVIMRGGEPQVTDSLRGTSRGAELTWFADDDKLLVNGAPDKPATSRILRK